NILMRRGATKTM
ncbi:rhs element Vgr family protein, partial [Vibrio cholerae HC-55C2]